MNSHCTLRPIRWFLSITLALSVLIALGCGGGNNGVGQRDAQPTQRSAILTAELHDIVEDWLRMNSETGEVDSERRDAMASNIAREMRGLLLVTEDMEADFEAGRYPEAERQAQIERMLSRLELFDAGLPGIVNMLVDEHYAGDLRGARLEIAWRMLNYYDSNIGQGIWPM